MRYPDNIKGLKFNKLLAIQETPVRSSSGGKIRIFLCDCGKEIKKTRNNVITGHTKSCGCMQHEGNNIKHGHTIGGEKTRIYSIYSNINKRCNNKNDDRFNSYGGRGIKCLWNSFEEFRDDMYESYLLHVEEFGEKNTSIDRINNDGNYEPSNCRRTTNKIQSKNKRDSIYININGNEIHLIELCNLLGIKPGTVRTDVFRKKISYQKYFDESGRVDVL